MQLLQGVSQSMKTVSGNSSADDLTRVSSELVQVKDRVREKLQAATAGDISKILEKLDNQELLTPAEKDLVGFWLVGDAEGFTKMEADFSDWQEEFRRLTGMIDSFAGKGRQSPKPGGGARCFAGCHPGGGRHRLFSGRERPGGKIQRRHQQPDPG